MDNEIAVDDEMRRLLNNGGTIPSFNLRTMALGENSEKFVSRSDLVEFLHELEEAAMSDQKQESYKGLRKLLKSLK